MVSITILFSDWMEQEDFVNEALKYGAEAAIEKGCPQWNNQDVIWLDYYDAAIIDTMLSHDPPAEILYNFRAWYDDGTQEVRITEKNYKQYDYKQFYYERSNKYDPVQIEPMDE